MEKDGKPYCNKDFYHLFAPRCSGCGESVRENYLSAANGTWHPECFVCAVSPLTSDHTHATDSHTKPGSKMREIPTHLLYLQHSDHKADENLMPMLWSK